MLTDFEVRTVSCGLNFSRSMLWLKLKVYPGHKNEVTEIIVESLGSCRGGADQVKQAFKLRGPYSKIRPVKLTNHHERAYYTHLLRDVIKVYIDFGTYMEEFIKNHKSHLLGIDCCVYIILKQK